MSAYFAHGQTDLFGGPILSGFDLEADVISRAQEQAMIAQINRAELRPFRFQQWTGKRLTRSYGWSYEFDTGIFAPAEAIPDWLIPLKARAAHFAGLAPANLVQALVTRYDPGAGIGWHRDRPVFEHVIGISLGATASMRFRRRREQQFDRASAPLEARSIYHLSGEARHHWEHSIAEMDATRWSITFRSLAR